MYIHMYNSKHLKLDMKTKEKYKSQYKYRVSIDLQYIYTYSKGTPKRSTQLPEQCRSR